MIYSATGPMSLPADHRVFFNGVDVSEVGFICDTEKGFVGCYCIDQLPQIESDVLSIAYCRNNWTPTKYLHGVVEVKTAEKPSSRRDNAMQLAALGLYLALKNVTWRDEGGCEIGPSGWIIHKNYRCKHLASSDAT